MRRGGEGKEGGAGEGRCTDTILGVGRFSMWILEEKEEALYDTSKNLSSCARWTTRDTARVTDVPVLWRQLYHIGHTLRHSSVLSSLMCEV